MTSDQATIYDEIWTEAGFPFSARYGNAIELLNYNASGEASDWVLRETGIIATSPELGTQHISSFAFDIKYISIEASVILQNMGLPMYMLNKATA